MNKPFETPVKYGKNETSRSDVGASSPALDIRTCEGGPTMPVAANITLRDDSASEQSPKNWKSVGSLAAELVEKAKAGRK